MFESFAGLISQALGSILVTIVSAMASAFSWAVGWLLNIFGVLVAVVFKLAYSFLTMGFIVDVGALFGVGHFPSSEMVASITYGNYTHLLVVMTDNSTDWMGGSSGWSGLGLADSSARIMSVFIAGKYFVFFQSIVMAGVVLALGLMIFGMLKQWFTREPSDDLSEDMLFLLRAVPDVLMGFVMMILTFFLFAMIGLFPYWVGGKIESSFGVIEAVGDTGGSIAQLFRVGAWNVASAIGFAGIGEALTYTIVVFFLLFAVVSVLSMALTSILVAPSFLALKRLMITIVVYLMLPFSYVGGTLKGGGGSSLVKMHAFDALSESVQGIFNEIEGVVKNYVKRMVNSAIGIVMFALLLKIIGEIADQVRMEVQSGQFNAYAGSLKGNEFDIFSSLLYFMIGTMLMIVFVLLLNKVEKIDEIGMAGWLDFSRMDDLLARNVNRALGMAMMGVSIAGSMMGMGVGALAGAGVTALAPVGAKVLSGLGAFTSAVGLGKASKFFSKRAGELSGIGGSGASLSHKIKYGMARGLMYGGIFGAISGYSMNFLGRLMGGHPYAFGYERFGFPGYYLGGEAGMPMGMPGGEEHKGIGDEMAEKVVMDKVTGEPKAVQKAGDVQAGEGGVQVVDDTEKKLLEDYGIEKIEKGGRVIYRKRASLPRSLWRYYAMSMGLPALFITPVVLKVGEVIAGKLFAEMVKQLDQKGRSKDTLKM